MFRWKALPQWAGAAVIFIGALTLAGWAFDIHTLKSVFPGLVSMKPNTAVCFIFGGAALLLQTGAEPVTRSRCLLARVLASVLILIAALTLAEYLLGRNLGLDQLLFLEPADEAGRSFPGRMSPASTVDFMLLGSALSMFDVRTRRNGLCPAELLTLAAMVVTLLAFVGYFYGVESLSRIAPYSGIALHTVLAFWLLCMGILFARPDRGVMAVFTSDTYGGLLDRRMLPAAILLPLLAGWLCVLGERSGLYGLGLGSALLATILIGTFTALITLAAAALNRAEAERRASQAQLRSLAGRLLAVREEERTNIAREIHDVLAQELTRLKMDIAWLKRRLVPPIDQAREEMVRERLAGMSELADTAIGSVQRIATELRPVVLDSLGLCAAVEWQAKDFEARTGIHCVATLPRPELYLQRDHSTALFRILQESLTNVARHSAATRVEIALRSEPGWVNLTVRDNGRGIRASELDDPRSVGLVGMRERATLLGGECRIDKGPEGGTSVAARLPFGPDRNSNPQLS